MMHRNVDFMMRAKVMLLRELMPVTRLEMLYCWDTLIVILVMKLILVEFMVKSIVRFKLEAVNVIASNGNNCAR